MTRGQAEEIARHWLFGSVLATDYDNIESLTRLLLEAEEQGRAEGAIQEKRAAVMAMKGLPSEQSTGESSHDNDRGCDDGQGACPRCYVIA